MTSDREAWCARMRARILRNVELHESGCWLWRGRRNNQGYGIITERVDGYKHPRPLFVHRVAWVAFRRRRMPKGRVGAHSYKCVSNACCNWEHIRATTQAHNCRDIKRAARWRRRCVAMEFPPTHRMPREKPLRPSPRDRARQ